MDLRNTPDAFVVLEDAIPLKAKKAYKYKDEISNKEFVAKLMDITDEEDNNAALISEFQKMARLSSEPEIGTVHWLTSITLDGIDRTCYVMDFINGQTLENLFQTKSALPIDDFFNIISQIALGLEKAHHFGVIHNDLHTGNIMINEMGYVKIIDFSWYDSSIKSASKDLKDFIKLLEGFQNNGIDIGLIEILTNHCKSVSTFQKLSKKIDNFSEIYWELSLIKEDAHKKMLAVLLKHIDGFTFQGGMVVGEKEIPIPKKFIPANERLQSLHQEEAQNNIHSRGHILLSMEQDKNIREAIEHHFIYKLHVLSQFGFCTWESFIYDTNPRSYDNYTLTYLITPTIKLIKWQKFNSEFNFLSLPNIDLTEAILE